MTLHFNDIAHYQGTNFPITGAALIAKATEGTGFVDSAYAGNRSRTVSKGLPFAGYHFLRGDSDPVAQAKHAFAVIGKTPAMADVEKADDGSYPTWAQTKAFFTAYWGLGGVMHLGYIPRWFWEDYWHSPDMTWLDDHQVALISSSYVHTYSDTGVGWNEYVSKDGKHGGVVPTIWQYTDGDTSRGYSYGLNGVDTNAFKGTEAQLGAVFNGTTGEDEMTAEEFLALLKDPAVTSYMRAVAWQYSGGGIDMASTLAAMNAASKATTDADLAPLKADIDALKAQAEANGNTLSQILAALQSGTPPTTPGAALTITGTFTGTAE
jgi:hypothetical protein